MASSNEQHAEEDLDEMLAIDDAAEEIEHDGQDVAMDSDGDGADGGGDQEEEEEEEELVLQNDSIAYFDLPQDSLFAIAQHPVHPTLVAVGGSAGQEEDAPGAGWLFDTAAAQSRPVLPPSYGGGSAQSTQLGSLFSLDGHTDSINTLCWTQPTGKYLVSGGLDGRIQAWQVDAPPRSSGSSGSGIAVTRVGEAQEVEEVNWIAACPSADHPDTVALGASDGSVWVYALDATDASNPLQIVQSYFLHTGPCTAGAWTPDGRLLATVSEDSSLYVWDVWGAAAASGGVVNDNGMTAVSLTGQDQRFEVEGGLYSIAIDPKGTFVAAGGAGGAVKIVSLPRLAAAPTLSPSSSSKSKAKSKSSAPSSQPTTATTTHAGGQILASLHTQGDSVESLAIALSSAAPPTVLVAAGSVDGSICVYDATRRFAVRRHIAGAHDEHSVVRLDFVAADPWLLTSCGMDGVVRRWDLRSGGATGTTAAGDDGVALVFEA
ncbi:WD40 repeat-like-containing domain protein [Moelleriella libera RCEF 2490]|uniref:WD40 repeat-like-containing domain protein n=1 Tax=Moelleriella libera RCEF 2490 TaxID=1081109 RepID=A0A168EME1_9HYPO|nr:WD40 repeat-like-containing domain protein [Moelleriella libera RCEF 2490]